MPSDYERPFIDDGSQFGISRADFEAMDEQEQREHMLLWFHQNFEDPANETPWVEGEYLYLWGGPYEPREQLWEAFEGIAPEALIEEVADEIESEGVGYYAPKAGSRFYDDPRDEEDDEEPEPPSLDIYLNEPSDRYGSPEEREARERAIEAIDRLREAVDAPRPIGIGHNRPPPDFEEPDEIKELRPALQELRTELAQPDPSIALVKRWATPLRHAVIASLQWTLKKIDGAITAVVNAGAVGGVFVLYTHPEYIQQAYDAIVHWLDIAAKLPF